VPDSGYPNYLKVLPDGSVVADFDGHVNAQGLDLQADASTPADQQLIRWLLVDGERVGYVGMAENGFALDRSFLLVLEQGVREKATATLRASRDEGAAEVIVQTGDGGISPGAFLGERVRVRAGAQLRTLLLDDGTSDFAQPADVAAAIAAAVPYELFGPYEAPFGPLDQGEAEAVTVGVDAAAIVGSWTVNGAVGQVAGGDRIGWSYAGNGQPDELVIFVCNNSPDPITASGSVYFHITRFT
jgi:hypothetical protein